MSAGRCLILACGALAREIRAITAANGLTHLDLHCLPAELHNRPERIPAAVEAAARKWQRDYERIFVAYADCGTGGQLQAVCDRLGLEMISGPHCYAFFQGDAAPEHDPTTFFLTDFLARQFDAFVWRPLGLDQHPELLPLYFGNYQSLTYLAQTDDPALTARAENAAQKLGLRFERRFTGYGNLPGWLGAIS